jgi:hypothetical protein
MSLLHRAVILQPEATPAKALILSTMLGGKNMDVDEFAAKIAGQLGFNPVRQGAKRKTAAQEIPTGDHSFLREFLQWGLENPAAYRHVMFMVFAPGAEADAERFTQWAKSKNCRARKNIKDYVETYLTRFPPEAVFDRYLVGPPEMTEHMYMMDVGKYDATMLEESSHGVGPRKKGILSRAYRRVRDRFMLLIYIRELNRHIDALRDALQSITEDPVIAPGRNVLLDYLKTGPNYIRE